jgi:mitotic-spindle organizing protein 1
MSSAPADPRAATAATVDVVTEIAGLLNTGLDRKAVQITMALVDAGVNPAALAAAIVELRKQARELGLEKR